MLVFKEFHIASLIHFELIFMKGTIFRSRFSFSLYGDVQFNCSSTISLKNYLFSISLLFTIWQKRSWLYLWDGILFLGFFILSIVLFVFFPSIALCSDYCIFEIVILKSDGVRPPILLLPFNIILAELPWWLNH